MLTIEPLRDFLRFLPSLPVPTPTQQSSAAAGQFPAHHPSLLAHTGPDTTGSSPVHLGLHCPCGAFTQCQSHPAKPLSRACCCLTPSPAACPCVSKRLGDPEHSVQPHWRVATLPHPQAWPL